MKGKLPGEEELRSSVTRQGSDTIPRTVGSAFRCHLPPTFSFPNGEMKPRRWPTVALVTGLLIEDLLTPCSGFSPSIPPVFTHCHALGGWGSLPCLYYHQALEHHSKSTLFLPKFFRNPSKSQHICRGYNILWHPMLPATIAVYKGWGTATKL